MPPFFMYVLSAEKKLNHKMEEMKNRADHSKKVNEWAEESKISDNTGVNGIRRKDSCKEGVTNKQLMALYRKSVEESGVRIIPGDTLSIHHQTANFFQENPFKILAGLGGKARC